MIKVDEKNKEKEEAKLDKLMAELSKKTAPLLNERSELEKKLISLRKDVDQAQSAFDIAQSELKLYTSIELIEKEKFEKVKQSLEVAKNNLISRNVELQNLNNQIPSKAEELVKVQKELEVTRKKENEVALKLKGMRISFEEQKFAMQANRSRNKIIDSLMREKREGRIPGVFGRLVCKLTFSISEII